jgi:hypothetical protein
MGPYRLLTRLLMCAADPELRRFSPAVQGISQRAFLLFGEAA